MEKRPLLYEEVIENLYRLIDSGKIKPGETFPSERVLIGEWDISRNVLREAFHILEQRGLITSRQGKGRFLRKLPDDQHRDMSESTSKMIERCSLLEIYQVRQMLEAKACGLTALRITDSDVNELEKCYQKVAEQFRQNGTTKGEFEIHKMYLEKCRLYVSGENLFTITKYSGIDPEFSSSILDTGVDSFVYPFTRSFVVGLQVTF